ncbi:MAG: TetR/AcrR family transcriptional regulator [Ktedonobacteraceae bacterium]
MARTPKVVEDRREQIIDAAMQVFAQKGFVRATNKDIAQEAGITPGLIYHYFASKEALLQAIVEDRSPLRLIRSFSPDIVDQPPHIFLPFLARQVLGIAEDERFVQFIRVFLPEILHNPKISPIGAGAIQQALRFLDMYFSTRIAAGDLRAVEPALAAQIFMSSVVGFVFRRQILHDSSLALYTQEQIADFVVETMLGGLDRQ